MSDEPVPPSDGLRALLAHRPYARYLAVRFAGSLATGTQAVVLAWEVYETARQTMPVPEASLAVGLIGLCQVLPLAALTLVAGKRPTGTTAGSSWPCASPPSS